MSRRKNPHPQRAVNARTVLKVVRVGEKRKREKRKKGTFGVAFEDDS